MRLVFIALFTSLLVAPMSAAAQETPDHEVIVKDGKFEIRAYEPKILAEVEVTGSMRQAGNSGFEPLAGYIFGDNTARTKIDMTAPVTRTPSQKIDMTAPVTQTPSGEDSWIVSFVMPDKWTMDTLPVPNNEDVTLREVPGEMLATVRFSGAGRMETQIEQREALTDWIDEQGYEITGPVRYAGYDAPWKPAPLKRNEVMFPVEKAAASGE